jgi:hypothetical protein
MLRIFTLVKIQRLWPALNPRTREPEASMLTTRPPKPSTPQKKSFYLETLNDALVARAVGKPRTRWEVIQGDALQIVGI